MLLVVFGLVDASYGGGGSLGEAILFENWYLSCLNRSCG